MPEQPMTPTTLHFGVALTVGGAECLEAVVQRGFALEKLLADALETPPTDEADPGATANPPCWVLESEATIGHNVRARTYNLGNGRKRYCREQQAIIVQYWRDINNNKTRSSRKLGAWEEESCFELPDSFPDVNSP